MAYKPDAAKANAIKNANTAQILNAIRNDGTEFYRSNVPVAQNTVASVRAVGSAILEYQATKNEFLTALVNRIGRVLLTSKLYDNPWSMFKKGMLEYGESIEDIFVNIAKVHQFDPEVAETEVYKREIPDVRTAFYRLNYQKFYKATISHDQLKQAFLSLEGVNELVAGIVDAMYTGAAYDEFQVMKYMLAREILDGNFYGVNVGAVSADNASTIVSTIKGVANKLTFLTDNYNPAGVKTYSNFDDQYLILNANFEATVGVNVLATAFNRTDAEFMGHRVLVDGFGDLDTDRLNMLFGGMPGYEEIGSADLQALNEIPGVTVDRNFFMIFDNLYNFTENYNGQGLYWNYFYHTWKTFAVSPFANRAVFTTAAPGVTSVTVSPSAITLSKGASTQLTATVQTTDFAPQTVTWTSSSENTTVDANGYVTVGASETNATVTITATSTFDASKKDECVITVSGN